MVKQKATNVVWHQHKVERKDREELLKQKGVVIWFTGLPSSGKSTVATRWRTPCINLGDSLTYWTAIISGMD